MRNTLILFRKQRNEARHLMDVIKENKRYSDRLLQLNETLREEVDALLKSYEELADWVKSVKDPEIRDILILYYIQGKTHEQVAQELGYAKLTVLRKIKRFWNEQEMK